jgi:hypothetical protein
LVFIIAQVFIILLTLVVAYMLFRQWSTHDFFKQINRAIFATEILVHFFI